MENNTHDLIHLLAEDAVSLKRAVNGCGACPCREIVDRILNHVDAVIQAAKLMEQLK